MRRLACVTLCAAACNASYSAPNAAPAKIAGGGATVIAEKPAWDYTAAAGKLVVIEDGFLVVSAIDAATGAAAWRQALQKEAHGRQTLHPSGVNVIAWL